MHHSNGTDHLNNELKVRYSDVSAIQIPTVVHYLLFSQTYFALAFNGLALTGQMIGF